MFGEFNFKQWWLTEGLQCYTAAAECFSLPKNKTGGVVSSKSSYLLVVLVGDVLAEVVQRLQ